MRSILILILGLIGLFPNISFAADRVIPCDGANCKIIFETKNGSNVKVQAAQIDGTGVMSFPSAGGGMVPAGTIIAFAGASTPAGYLPCDGAAVSQTTYAALYAALGSTWDTQRNKSTGSNYSSPGGGLFRVPDLRGTFLKGTGTPAAPYSATALAATQDDKTAKNNISVSGGTASGTFASTNHIHQWVVGATRRTWNSAAVQFDGFGNAATGSGLYGLDITVNSYTNVPSGGAGSATASVSSTAASISSSDTDTVPINVGVNYFIKY